MKIPDFLPTRIMHCVAKYVLLLRVKCKRKTCTCTAHLDPFDSAGAMFLSAVQACAKGGQWERALSLMVERRTVAAKEAKDKRGASD